VPLKLEGKLSWTWGPLKISLSFSAGVTGYYGGATVDELIKHADVALYQCKAKGRTCVSLNLATNPTT
jgi:GGDEF domain-containing protein